MRWLPDLTDTTSDPGQPVTPEDVSSVPAFSDIFQSAWESGHSSSTCEHSAIETAQAACVVEWDGANYTVRRYKNCAATVTRTAAGDIKIDLTITMAHADQWAFVVRPIPLGAGDHPVGTPIYAYECNSAANRTTSSCRFLMFNEAGALKDESFLFVAWGRRA